MGCTQVKMGLSVQPICSNSQCIQVVLKPCLVVHSVQYYTNQANQSNGSVIPTLMASN